MLTLITGTPGAGKTLRAVQKLMQYKEHNDKMREKLKKGETLDESKCEFIFNLYSNIKGLKIDEVKEAPLDWRECTSPAKWFRDEAQYDFPATNQRGLDNNPIIAEVATHRHTGIDLYLITQHPQLISSHVRKFVGRHEHLDRRYGSKLVSLYTNDALMSVDGSLSRFDSEPWAHPSKLFDYYESASLHIKNTRIPFSIKFIISFILIMILILGLAVYKSMDFFTGKVDSKKITDNSHSVPELSNAQHLNNQVEIQKSVNVFSGCITSLTKCSCWDEEGDPVHFENLNQCKSTFENMPLKLATKKRT